MPQRVTPISMAYIKHGHSVPLHHIDLLAAPCHLAKPVNQKIDEAHYRWPLLLQTLLREGVRQQAPVAGMVFLISTQDIWDAVRWFICLHLVFGPLVFPSLVGPDILVDLAVGVADLVGPDAHDRAVDLVHLGDGLEIDAMVGVPVGGQLRGAPQ